MAMDIEVDMATAERILGRKLNALDRFLGLATDRAITLVAGNMRGRLKLLKRPQNVQDAPRRTRPRVNPVRTRREGADGIVELRPHLTSARSPAVQQLLRQLGLEKQLVRTGLWMDPARITRDPATGRFTGSSPSRGSGGYSSRQGLRFYRFSKYPKLLAWAQNKDRGTQLLRHTVRLSSPDALVKLITAPTVKFCRQRIFAIFEAATKQAMETE